MQRALTRNPEPSSSTAGEGPQQLGPTEMMISCLWVLTPLAATVSVLIVLVAMATNQWLHTEEKMTNPNYNGTGEKEYLSKCTISGLWTLCFTNPGETPYECNRIDYFTKEKYSPDPNDSTMAIPYAVTKSIIFFIGATILLLVSYCCCISGQCVRNRRFCTFVSGVAFIISGLVMLLGLIVYISVFKAEVGGKLRPKSQLQPPTFTYKYGYSFLLYVGGFIGSQMAGICAIFLFIYRMQHQWHRKQLEDVQKGKAHTPPPTLNYYHVDHSLFYPCRRHPQAYINSNSSIQFPSAPPPAHPRRYFFSKDAPSSASPCSLHRPISAFDFPPPPPTISCRLEEMKGYGRRAMPRDATTNTVSTTADVPFDDFYPDDFSPEGREHEFVTFDLEQPLSRRAPSSLSVNSSRLDLSNDPHRRTTPV